MAKENTMDTTLGGGQINKNCPSCGGELVRDSGGSAESAQWVKCGRCGLSVHETELLGEADRLQVAIRHWEILRNKESEARTTIAQHAATLAYRAKTGL